MPYFALFYDVIDTFLARRGEFRAAHLRAVSESYARRELILGGALGEPADTALLVFEVSDPAIVEAFVRQDPYVTGGLVRGWKIRPWNVVTGKEALSEPPAPAHPTEIARAWSARSSAANWPGYREHFEKRVLPELRATTGYVGATLYVRPTGDGCEILVQTFWRSLDSVRAFAGVDLEAAVVAREAAAVLTDYDRRVRHYEIVVSDFAGA